MKRLIATIVVSAAVTHFGCAARQSESTKLPPLVLQPGPGMMTGVILPADDGPVYVTGLDDALIRLDR